MTIKEFIEAYKGKKFINTQQGMDERVEWLKSTLGVKEYIPFAEKRELCATVIDACCVKKNGLIKIDSVSRYIIFTISIISAYTKLEFSSDEKYDSLDEYDMLCESGTLNPILALIGEEYTTCNNMLNMMMDDVIANNNTIEMVFSHELSKVSDALDSLILTFSDKIDEMELDLNQIDIDKYKWLFDLIPKK